MCERKELTNRNYFVPKVFSDFISLQELKFQRSGRIKFKNNAICYKIGNFAILREFLRLCVIRRY